MSLFVLICSTLQMRNKKIIRLEESNALNESVLHMAIFCFYILITTWFKSCNFTTINITVVVSMHRFEKVRRSSLLTNSFLPFFILILVLNKCLLHKYIFHYSNRSSINQITVLGGGSQGLSDNSTKALAIKRMNMGKRVSKIA